MHDEILTTDSVWEQELIEHIGQVALVELERRYGGSFLYIHANKPSAELVAVVGQEKAQILSDEYGCTDIYVPTQMAKQVRNIQIRKERKAGKTVKELAADYRLSANWVQKILTEKYNYGTYTAKRTTKTSK